MTAATEQPARPAGERERAAVEEERDPGALTTDLLGAYQRTLDSIDQLQQTVWVRQSPRVPKLRIPRFRWLVRPFVVLHVGRSLAGLKRRHYARCALGLETDDCAELRAIENFERSLPPPPSRLAVSLSLFSVFVVALALGSLLASTGEQSRPLAKTTRAMLSLDPGSVVDALTQFDSAESVLVGSLALSAALYLVLFAPMSSFRLKRILFNMHPDPDPERVASTYATNHVFRSEGVYSLESEVYSALGGRRPQEVRLDLIVEAVLMVLSLCLGIFFIAGVLGNATAGEANLGEVFKEALFGEPRISLPAVGLLMLSSWRLVHLRRMYRHRTVDEWVAPAQERVAATAESLGLTLAGWRRRALAQSVDWMVIGIVGFIVGLLYWNLLTDQSDLQAALALYVIGPGVAYALNSLLLVRRGKRNGQTLGKRLLGLRVVALDDERIRLRRALEREVVGKWLVFGLLSAIALSIPMIVNYLWPLWDDGRRALHDRLATTAVVRA